MVETETFKDSSFTTENEAGGVYRRLSRLAIWSIPLGLLSALALISPLLWFVPIVAIVFACGGLWGIARSDDITGRPLALLGLGLAVLFGTWGVSWTMSRQAILDQQARERAAEWLTLFQQQEIMQAHQLSLDYFSRLPPGASLAEHYAERDPEEISPEERRAMPPGREQTPHRDLIDFKSDGIPQILNDAKGAFEFSFVANRSVRRSDEFTVNVKQIFRITFPEDHQPSEMDVEIEMKRTVDNGKAYWQAHRMTEAS